jgi:hypothetical protein
MRDRRVSVDAAAAVVATSTVPASLPLQRRFRSAATEASAGPRSVLDAACLHTATLDASPPGTRGLPDCLDELPETLEVAAHAPLDHAKRVAGLLHHPIRLDVELEDEMRPVRAEGLELDGAVVARPVDAAP